MKTPEQMAEEYAKTEGQPWGCERHFLAGYQAAKDQIADVSNKGKVMETIDAKNTIESVIEMLEEHLDNICKAGLSEEGTDSLLHRPSYVLNLLRFFNEQQKTQES